jgi:antitoxin ParD1/3/4
LGPRLEESVDRLVRAGRYRSASDVIREGIRLVEEREAQFAALQANASVFHGRRSSREEPMILEHE